MITDIDGLTPNRFRQICAEIRDYAVTPEDAAYTHDVKPEVLREYCAKNEEAEHQLQKAKVAAKKRWMQKLDSEESMSTAEQRNLQFFLKALDARFDPRGEEEDKTFVANFGEVPPPPEKMAGIMSDALHDLMDSEGWSEKELSRKLDMKHTYVEYLLDGVYRPEDLQDYGEE